MATIEILEATRNALWQIQGFDPKTLGREADLGRLMNFSEAVGPAEKIIAIYKQIPIKVLDDFTDSQLTVIKINAETDYNIFKQILEFNNASGDSVGARNNILSSINVRRDQLFDQIWLHVVYAVVISTNINNIDSQVKEAIQRIQNQSGDLLIQMNKAKSEADSVLSTIRSFASEQGVSHQAIFFRDEAQAQENLADKWLSYTYRFAIALGGFAILSLFLHKIDWIIPNTTAEMLQLISSKILIFTVLGYMLLMAAKNYATYKHNSVVNRHRHNALQTYKTLVKAADEKDTQDIVLAHAASCIFSPQDTGFSYGKNDIPSGSKSVLELLTKGPSKSSD